MSNNVNSLFDIVFIFRCFRSIHTITYIVYSELTDQECRRTFYLSYNIRYTENTLSSYSILISGIIFIAKIW